MKALRNKLDSAKAALKTYDELNEQVNVLSADILTKKGDAFDAAISAFDDAFTRKKRAAKMLISSTKAVVAACGLVMVKAKGKIAAEFCRETLLIMERRIEQAEAILQADDFWESLYVTPRN